MKKIVVFFFSLFLMGCIGGASGDDSPDYQLTNAKAPDHAQRGGGGNDKENDDDDKEEKGNRGGGNRNKDKDEDPVEDEPIDEDEPITEEQVSLSWQIDYMRENGELMYTWEVDGVEISYREQNQSNYSIVDFIPEEQEQTVSIVLNDGVYYFVGRTRDIDGLWSRFTDELKVEIE